MAHVKRILQEFFLHHRAARNPLGIFLRHPARHQFVRVTLAMRLVEQVGRNQLARQLRLVAATAILPSEERHFREAGARLPRKPQRLGRHVAVEVVRQVGHRLRQHLFEQLARFTQVLPGGEPQQDADGAA